MIKNRLKYKHITCLYQFNLILYYAYKVSTTLLVFWNNIFDKKKTIKKCNVLCKYNIFLVAFDQKKKMKMKKKEEEKKITEVNRFIFICYVTKLRKCRIWKKRWHWIQNCLKHMNGWMWQMRILLYKVFFTLIPPVHSTLYQLSDMFYGTFPPSLNERTFF